VSCRHLLFVLVFAHPSWSPCRTVPSSRRILFWLPCHIGLLFFVPSPVRFTLLDPSRSYHARVSRPPVLRSASRVVHPLSLFAYCSILFDTLNTLAILSRVPRQQTPTPRRRVRSRYCHPSTRRPVAFMSSSPLFSIGQKYSRTRRRWPVFLVVDLGAVAVTPVSTIDIRLCTTSYHPYYQQQHRRYQVVHFISTLMSS